MRLFVVGTGTDVGKTVVCAALCKGLAARRGAVGYWKPVQTGVLAGSAEGDAAVVAAQAGSGVYLHPSILFCAPPASPDQAARSSGVEAPSVSALLAALQALPDPAEQVLVIEGAGGLLVPLNQRAETWADLVAGGRLPVLVAAHSGLGTLNHTALTVQALQARGIVVLGVVLCGPPHADNHESLGRLLPGVALHHLPWLEGLAAHRDWESESRKLADFVLAGLTPQPTPAPWLDLDQRHCWHPYTQHQVAPPPLPVVGAQGVWLELASGQRLIDGVSSWWVNNIGHGRPEIARALSSQALRLDHVLFAGMTHEPAALLAQQVLELAGPGLSRAFFSDNGSTAVEVALKIAYQGFCSRGEPQRHTFLAFRGGYHGDTFGAMSVSAQEDFFAAFRPLLFQTAWADVVTSHPSALCPRGEAALEQGLEALEAQLEREHQRLCGVILEPLVQGAGGMLMQPAGFLRGVAALCRRFGLPLILDEVFTGFGRTGALFAFQRAGVEPDIVCVAKGLTGGTLPLAMTLSREAHFQSFCSEDRSRALLHGHSYTANALSCSAALAALDILRREDLAGRALRLERRWQAWLESAGQRLGCENGRALGGILAFELPGSGPSSYFSSAGQVVARRARERGLLIRPLGNTVYFMPPLSISDDEAEQALAALAAALSP